MNVFKKIYGEEIPLILAPMAGVSSLPFRVVTRAFGCRLAFVEMLCVRSLASRNKKTLDIIRTNPEDAPLGIQILASEEKYIAEGLDVIKGNEYEIIDFNAACPTRKVVSNGKGAALLKDPAKMNRLLKATVRAVKTPVTVKIRIGWDNTLDVKDIARYAEDAGVSAIFVHGRTRTQGYAGAVDYDAIRQVKESVKVPVIGSGDVFSAELALAMLSETGCDGLLIARGALGKPWVFREIESAIKGEPAPVKPGPTEVLDAMKKQFELAVNWEGEKRAVKHFHKFFIWYTGGFPRVKALRVKACKTRTRFEMEELFKDFLEVTCG